MKSISSNRRWRLPRIKCSNERGGKRASQEKDWEVVGSINAFDGVLKEPTEIMVLDDKTVAEFIKMGEPL